MYSVEYGRFREMCRIRVRIRQNKCILITKVLFDNKKGPTLYPPPHHSHHMDEDADSPSIKALFASMKDMQEAMQEVKATAVCVWPGGPSSYLKGRVNERKDNKGDLVCIFVVLCGCVG